MRYKAGFIKHAVKLEKAKNTLKDLKNFLKPYSSKIELVGSITREHPEVGDIDILVVPKKNINLRDVLKRRKVSGGNTYLKFNYNRVPVNLWVTSKNSIGAAKLHYSVGKDIMRIKNLAKEKGMKLTQHGLFKDDKLITGKSDKDILELLNKDVDHGRFIKEKQYPRETENYFRFRQLDPKEFNRKSFRTIKTNSGAKIIGKHKDGDFKVQSIMFKKASFQKKAKGFVNKGRLIKRIPATSDKKWEFVIQKHIADKAGLHYDVRLGDPNTGYGHSWVVRRLPGKNERVLAKHVFTHDIPYFDFKGEIKKGYGKGKVEHVERGKAHIKNSIPGKLSFTTDSGNYALVKFKDKDTDWLLIRGKQ